MKSLFNACEYKQELTLENIQTPPQQIDYIIKQLKLKKNLSISKNDKTGLTTISYSNTAINKTKQIIDEYLIQLKKLNLEVILILKNS